jgi:hypothetical protein
VLQWEAPRIVDDPQLAGIEILHPKLVSENIPAFGDGGGLYFSVAYSSSSGINQTREKSWEVRSVAAADISWSLMNCPVHAAFF